MIGTAPSEAKTTKTPITLGALLLIFLLGTGLRLHQLDTDSSWVDEAEAVITSRLDFVSILNSEAEESTHPPLTYILSLFFLAFLGNSDFVLRI